MRADQCLVHQGHASSRAQAQRLIAGGGVQWQLPTGDWKPVLKNGDEVPDTAAMQLLDASEARYVSRGGLKLEGALAAVAAQQGVPVNDLVAGARCLDVGQSTGGFTDCLLQHGAAHVVGIDVGQGQLHPQLRTDVRVVCMEQINARHIVVEAFIDSYLIAEKSIQISDSGQKMPYFDWLVGDVSFISLTLVLPALVPLLAADAKVLLLVKPQFELQPGQVGRGGIVRDAALYAVVEQRIRDCCAALGLTVLLWLDSPITGGDGNREFFVFARRAP